MTEDEAIYESWCRGRLTYKLHAGQRKIKADKDRRPGQLFVGNCSRQWGKSYLEVVDCVELGRKKHGARIKYGTAFLTDLEEFIMPNFEKILDDCPKKLRPRYKTKGSKWVFPETKAEMKLVGLDKKPNGMRGNRIDKMVLDECGFMSNLSYLYKSVIIPATTHSPDCEVDLISTPPVTPAHDFGEFIKRAASEGCYGEYNIYSNPMVDKATIARLMKESGGELSTTWRREYLCQLITDADSQLVPEWDEKYIRPVTRDEFFQFYHLYEAMDLGVKDFTLNLFGYYDFRRAVLVIEDEIKLNGPTLTTQVLHDTVVAKEKALWPERKPYRRVADNNNPQLIQDLALLHRMSFVTTDKDTLEAMLNEARMWIQRGQVEVDPRCTQLLGCLKYGVWDAKKKQFARSAEFGHFDALAALIYLIRNVDRHANPIPHTYGFDVRNSRIKAQRHNSEGAKLLNTLFKKPTQKPTR